MEKHVLGTFKWKGALLQLGRALSRLPACGQIAVVEVQVIDLAQCSLATQ